MGSAFLRVLFLILFAAPAIAWAEGNPEPPADPSATASAGAVAGAAAGAVAGAAAGSINNLSQTLDASPSAVVGDVRPSSSNSLQIEGDDYPRQLAGIAQGAGQNTAPNLKCFNLFGGNASNGQATQAGGIWCWIVRDDFYLQEFYRYANWNMPEPASVAYCKSKLRYQAFGDGERGRAKCEVSIHQRVIEMHLDNGAWEPDPQPAGSMVRRDWCDERIERCEAAALK